MSITSTIDKIVEKPIGYVDLLIEFGDLAMPKGFVKEDAPTLETVPRLIETEIRMRRISHQARFFSAQLAR